MDHQQIFIRSPRREDSAPAAGRFSVAPPAAFLAGLCLLIAAVGAVAWCFLGTVTRSIGVTGIVFPHYGIKQVNSQVSGIVSYLQVEVGEEVEAGDLIAIIPQQELLQQMEQAHQQGDQAWLDSLYEEYQAVSMIYTPVSGRVVDLVQEGSAVEAGDLIVGGTNADATTNETEIRAYIPSTVAQSIQKGMEVRVYPNTSDTESYGYVQGMVSNIYDYPITETDISQTLGRFYTSQIIPQNENIVEVRITLVGGVEASTGAWARAEGGSIAIDTGMLCEMDVVVEEMTPWQFLRS